MLTGWGRSDQGQVRKSNQDAFRIVPEAGLCILADGMGGPRGGERAAALTVEIIAREIETSGCRDAATLIGSVEAANAAIFSEASRNPALEGMGSTVVAVLETAPGDVAIASVGDSRAWLLQNDSLRLLTKDQTWVEESARPMGLTEQEIRTHPMRHMLTMAVGVSAEIRIQYYAAQLQAEDLLLLTSDGLHGVVSESAIADILRDRGTSGEEKCDQLIAAADAAGSPDNVTVVLLRSQ